VTVVKSGSVTENRFHQRLQHKRFVPVTSHSSATRVMNGTDVIQHLAATCETVAVQALRFRVPARPDPW
jgi:hypothetical protein